MPPLVQNTFTIIQDIPSALNRRNYGLDDDDDSPNRTSRTESMRPMTTKQVKKAYREKTKGPKLSKAERRQQELFEQDRIRKEFEKERNLARARSAREKKREREEKEKTVRKERGLPLVDVRPSQDTLARFISKPKKGGALLSVVAEHSEDSENQGRDSKAGLTTGPERPRPTQAFGDHNKENIPPVPKKSPQRFFASDDSEGEGGDLGLFNLSNGPISPHGAQLDAEKENAPPLSNKISQGSLASKHGESEGRESGPAMAEINAPISRGAQSVNLKSHPKSSQRTQPFDDSNKENVRPPSKSTSQDLSQAHVGSIETIVRGFAYSPPLVNHSEPPSKRRRVDAPEEEIKDPMQKSVIGVKDVDYTEEDGRKEDLLPEMDKVHHSPRLRVDEKSIPSQQRSQEIPTKWPLPPPPLPKPPGDPRTPAMMENKPVVIEHKPPPSTQAMFFLNNHLDDFFPSPSQEVREIFDDKPGLPRIGGRDGNGNRNTNGKDLSTGFATPIAKRKPHQLIERVVNPPRPNPQPRAIPPIPIPTSIQAKRAAAIPKPPRREAHSTIDLPAPIPPGKAAAIPPVPMKKENPFEMPFFSTQDILLSSQDVKDIEESPLPPPPALLPPPLPPLPTKSKNVTLTSTPTPSVGSLTRLEQQSSSLKSVIPQQQQQQQQQQSEEEKEKKKKQASPPPKTKTKTKKPFLTSSCSEMRYKYAVERSKTMAWEGADARRKAKEELAWIRELENERLAALLGADLDEEGGEEGDKEVEEETRRGVDLATVETTDTVEKMEDVRGSRARLMVTSEIKPPLRPEPKRNPNTNTRLKSSYEAMLELLDKKPTTTTTTTTTMLRKQNSTGSICHQNQNQNQDPGENKDMHQGKDPDHDGVQKDGVKDLPKEKEKEKEKDSIIIPASQETDYDGGDWDDDDDLLRDIVL